MTMADDRFWPEAAVYGSAAGCPQWRCKPNGRRATPEPPLLAHLGRHPLSDGAAVPQQLWYFSKMCSTWP